MTEEISEVKKYKLQLATLILLILLPLGAYISPRLLSCEFSYPKMTLWMSVAFGELLIFSKRDAWPKTRRDWVAHLLGFIWIAFWTEVVWDTYLVQRYYNNCGREERMLAAFWLGIGLIVLWIILLLFSTAQYKKYLKTM